MRSRIRALTELREIAGQTTHGISVRDVQHLDSNDLYQSLLHHFGSFDAARAAAGVEGPPSVHQRWSAEVVVDELRKAHRAGIRLTIKGLSDAGLRGLANASHEYCGGLPQTRKLAQIPEPAPKLFERVRWDEDRVISEIRARHREGLPLARSKVSGKLANAAQYYFGGWREAIEAAKYDYDRVRLAREPYQRAELLDILGTLATTAPNTMLGDLHDHAAAEAWKRELDSIEEAAHAAGLDDWPIRQLEPLMAADEVLAAIHARLRTKQSLTSWDVELDDRHFQKSGVRQFGAWHTALAAAELPATDLAEALGDRRRWTKTSVRDALRARRRAGKSMSPSDLRDDDSGLFQAARSYLDYDADVAVLAGKKASTNLVAIAQRRFGSWRAALHKAGVPSKVREWSGSSIAEALATRVAEGRLFDPTTLRRENSSLYYAIKHRFVDVALTLRTFQQTRQLPSTD